LEVPGNESGYYYELAQDAGLEFQNYVQIMFRLIIRTDKEYVKRQYTIFVT